MLRMCFLLCKWWMRLTQRICKCHVSRGALCAARCSSLKKIAILYKSVLRGLVSITFFFYRPTQRVCMWCSWSRFRGLQFGLWYGRNVRDQCAIDFQVAQNCMFQFNHSIGFADQLATNHFARLKRDADFVGTRVRAYEAAILGRKCPKFVRYFSLSVFTPARKQSLLLSGSFQTIGANSSCLNRTLGKFGSGQVNFNFRRFESLLFPAANQTLLLSAFTPN